MTPEEAYALSRRIASLKRLGESLKKLGEEAGTGLADPRSNDDEHARSIKYKREAGVGEVEALVKSEFGSIPSFLARMNEIKSANEPSQAIQVLDLLDTIERFVFIQPQSVASDPLKNLIEQTLKERYFSSWEVKVLGGLFAFAIACLFGGTAYLGIQVQGVSNQAEAARKSIELERDSIVRMGNEAVSRIEANASEQAKAQIAKLNDALSSATNTITNLNMEIRNKTTAIGHAFDDGQKEIKTATEKAVGQIPAAAASSLSFKINEVMSQKVEDAENQIQEKIKSVNIQKKNFEDALPDVAKYTENRVKEFNEIVSRYQGRIDEILSR